MLRDHRVHATLPVADLERARAFWEGRLGFQPDSVLPGVVLYAAGGGSRFAASRTAGRPSGAHTQMAFRVDDLDTEVADLRGRGITFEEYDLPGLRTVGGIGPVAGGRAAWFRDPDGNMVAVLELPPDGA